MDVTALLSSAIVTSPTPMKTLLLAIAAGLLSACASVSDIPPSSTVALLPGADAALGTRAAVRFDAILDSRCPANVKCVWAGKIAYRFSLTGAGLPETFVLDANAPRHDSTRFAGVSVLLTPTVAPAVNNAGAVPTAHPVTLTITRQ